MDLQRGSALWAKRKDSCTPKPRSKQYVRSAEAVGGSGISVARRRPLQRSTIGTGLLGSSILLLAVALGLAPRNRLE